MTAAVLASVIRVQDEDLSWQDFARCAETDPDSFFPDKGESVAYAKRVCRSCGVQRLCLDYALRNRERFGVWGGLSEPERRQILNQKNLEEAA